MRHLRSGHRPVVLPRRTFPDRARPPQVGPSRTVDHAHDHAFAPPDRTAPASGGRRGRAGAVGVDACPGADARPGEALKHLGPGAQAALWSASWKSSSIAHRPGDHDQVGLGVQGAQGAVRSGRGGVGHMAGGSPVLIERQVSRWWRGEAVTIYAQSYRRGPFEPFPAERPRRPAPPAPPRAACAGRAGRAPAPPVRLGARPRTASARILRRPEVVIWKSRHAPVRSAAGLRSPPCPDGRAEPAARHRRGHGCTFRGGGGIQDLRR